MKGDKENTSKIKLPKEAVLEFQQLYFKSVGHKLTYQQAETEALNLLELYSLVQAS